MRKVMTVSGIIGPDQYRLRDGLGREQIIFSNTQLKIGEAVIIVNGVVTNKTKPVSHVTYQV